MPTILLLTFITVPFYLSCLMFSKLSMLTFYLRIFTTSTLFSWVFATIGLSVVWFLGHFLANIFICTPVAAQWKMELLLSGQGTCGDQIPLFQSMIISNMLVDLIIMALPIKTIWSLQMRFVEKIGLLASFLLLGAVIIVGSVRVHYVSTVNMREDLTKTMPVSLFLTTLEPNFAILCVSIPMLRPLYRSYRTRYGSSKGATKLSDNGVQTIGGSGGPLSGNANSKKGSRNHDIGLFTFDQQNKDARFTTAIDRASAHSLESGTSSRELTSSTKTTYKQ